MSQAGYAALFDASALAKNYLKEPGSDELRAFWNRHPTKYTTPFCLYETLGVLKLSANRRLITRAHYLDSAMRLVSWYRESSAKLGDLDLTSVDVFSDAHELASDHGLDLSDAFQILSLQAGMFSPLFGGSQSILVTADETLAEVARRLRLPVWDCVRDPTAPP